MPLQWRNQIWQSLEEGAGKRCSECVMAPDIFQTADCAAATTSSRPSLSERPTPSSNGHSTQSQKANRKDPAASDRCLPSLSPFLIGRTFASPNIVRNIRRTLLRFLIELIVPRTWFGQLVNNSELYFVLNWLIMRCKLQPELAAEAQQTA